MEPRINTLTVAVADLERSLAFYRDGLGWQPWWPPEGQAATADHAAFALQGGLSFVLYLRTALARDARDEDVRPGSAAFSLSHFVGAREDVERVLARAEAAGATRIGALDDEPWGCTGRFKDLDGHLWEVLWNPDYPVAGT